MNYKAGMTDETRATFTLRASRELLDRLKAAADEHSHSMNAEIIQRLEWTLDDYRFQLHGPSGFEPSDGYDAAEEMSNIEVELSDTKEQLKELESPDYESNLSPRERAGVAGMFRARIDYLTEKRAFLKKNMMEERIKALIEKANAKWDREHPDGDKSPYDLAVAEYDRIHGTTKED